MSFKQKIIISSIIVLFFCLFFYYITKDNPNKISTSVYVYYDITEGLSPEIKSEYFNSLKKIFNKMDLDVNKEYGGSGFGEIRLSFLNHEFFNKPITLSIKERDESYGSPILGKNKVSNFIKLVEDTLNFILNQPINRQDTISSVIIRHLFEDIIELNRTQYNNKIMIIFSDMIEHNPDFNISFITNPINANEYDSALKKIEETYKISFKDSLLKNIKMHIIRPDHEKYRDQRLKIELFWKYVFGKNCIYQNVLKF